MCLDAPWRRVCVIDGFDCDCIDWLPKSIQFKVLTMSPCSPLVLWQTLISCPMAFKYANYATDPPTLSICLGSLLIAARQLTFLYTPLAPERLQRFSYYALQLPLLLFLLLVLLLLLLLPLLYSFVVHSSSWWRIAIIYKYIFNGPPCMAFKKQKEKKWRRKKKKNRRSSTHLPHINVLWFLV